MGKTKTLLTAIVFAAFGVAGAAAPAAAGVDFSNPAFAQTGMTPTSIPIGHAVFCKSHEAECQPNRHVVADEKLTPALWQQLIAINTKYNTTIKPETDEQLYHTEEFWAYPHGYGDCEDYALAKRRDLIELGWPASTLLMTVVRQSDGEGHAVLMVRTDRGDLILDNQDGLIKLWKDTPYHYLKRQSQRDPGEWVDIHDTRPIRIATR